MKHKQHKQSGYHIAKMVPFEVIGFGSVVALTPLISFFGAVIAAAILMFVSYKVYILARGAVRNAPTVLGYGDVAVANTKKAAKQVAQTVPATRPRLTKATS